MKHSTTGARLALTLVLAAIVAGCAGAPAAGSTVGGFPIAAKADCATMTTITCDQITGLAKEVLDSRYAGHADVVSTTLYRANLTDPSMTVVAYGLADGTTRAIGVYCSGATIASCVPLTDAHRA